MSSRVLLLVPLLCAVGCRTVSGLSPGTVAKLKDTPDGFLSGEVEDLKDHALMNNRDFVYSVAVSKDGERAAFTHLGPKHFEVGMWMLAERPHQVANQTVNRYEFDVEALDFAPDGKTIVTAGRDGAIRFFSAETGSPISTYATEEPLVAVAFHPSGKYVATGSAKGLITVVSWPALKFAFEQRAHEGEIRNVAFSREGVLYSGGWDKSIVPFDAIEQEAPTDSARLRFERRGGYSVVRGTVNDKVPAAFALDARVPYVIITTEVAKAAGLDVPFLKDSVTIATPLGSTVVRVAKNQTLSFKALSVRDVDIAICDVCVPGETQGILGEAFNQRYEVTFDEIGGEAIFAAKQKAEKPETRPVLTLKPRRRLTFDWYVNDFSLDKSGRWLGVAFSETPAERNRDVYEREKKGIPEPLREGNCGAIVDAHTGLIVKKWSRHEGVVSTAAISPDGQTLATGGWDKRVYVHQPLDRTPIKREYGWSIRRVRFSEDGRFLVVGAWTPVNPLGDQQSEPAAMAYEVVYRSPEVLGGPTAVSGGTR